MTFAETSDRPEAYIPLRPGAASRNRVIAEEALRRLIHPTEEEASDD